MMSLQLDLFAADPAAIAITPAAPAPVPVVTAPKVAGTRSLHVGEHLIEYVLVRSKRRSIGFLVSDDGLRVTAPKWITITEIEQAVREKQRWIFTKLNEHRERSARRLKPHMQWRDGATFPYMGDDFILRLRPGQQQSILLAPVSRELIISLPSDAGEQQMKDRVLGWLQAQAKTLFRERLDIYAEKLGATYNAFSLSSATTQWGSCTSDGKIRLNWRLMHFSLPLIDYVVAHELAHLREMNHGPQFWETVQSIFPECEEARKTLRDTARETLPVF